MPPLNPSVWTDRLRQVLSRYDETLLRRVTGRLFRPRNQWPAEELIERSLDALHNAVACDRRLHDLDPACRQLLALIAHSRQPRWAVGNLVEMLVALGGADGLRPVLTLLETGLIYPDLGPSSIAPQSRNGAPPGPRLKNFEQWLTQEPAPRVFALPQVAERALGESFGVAECPGAVSPLEKGRPPAVLESDGLEWPLRLALVWQLASAGPFRRTQAGDFFKRDLDRLRGDALLNAPPTDALADLPDRALLAVELARVEGLVADRDGEVIAGQFPETWREGLPATLASLWAALPELAHWNMQHGWQIEWPPGNPYPSSYLLVLLLLARLPEGSWASPQSLERWLIAHHPYWHSSSRDVLHLRLETYLLGVAYPLRLIQATRTTDGEILVRLSPTGSWVLRLTEHQPGQPSFPQTLLVQPNLEILVYRQGLAPELIGRLAKLAAWKTLGAACTMDLSPETVYRALEAGESFESILQALQRHGMKAVPEAVVESIRTWSNRRDRIAVYSSAALLEFLSPEDLAGALARGLPAVRLGERLAVVADADSIDFRHFRLTSTRDYSLPPEKCVEIDDDGVTLRIDLTRSDLMVETEANRFAESTDAAPLNGRRQYRMTLASLRVGRAGGLTLQALENWFFQRSGRELSAAARLLWNGADTPAVTFCRRMVLTVATKEVADGLVQWPDTRGFIRERLGPTALAVDEEAIERLQERLRDLGVEVRSAGNG
jgi:hypothetical protein